MDEKEALLDTIRQGLHSGLITPDDLEPMLRTEPFPLEAQSPMPTVITPAAETPETENHPEASTKLSVVDVLFYLAGMVLYVALMVMAFQSSATGPGRSLIMLASGLCFWALSFTIGRQVNQSENRVGFVNAALLTGSLSLISGGAIAAFEVVGGSDGGSNLGYALALVLVILGGLHLFFDMLLRRPLLIVFGMLLLVAAFPVLMEAMLANQNLPFDVWTLIGMATGVLTAAAGFVAARTAPHREGINDSFLSLAGFFILGSAYGATLGSSYAALWSIVLPLLIYAAFYMSIKRRSKNFLVTGSIFLVLFVITISFKYFAGLGVAFSLVLSATALLGTAFMASAIHKRYIKIK